jgi:hypothetical protein
MFQTPILFLIFNRPSLTQTVFSVIRELKPSFLFIAADGPRYNVMSDLEDCENARKITEQIDWDCKVMRLYQKNNLGCSLGPRTAFKWFFSNVEEGIIIEDDCLPNLDFFHFTSLMLNHYRNDKKIFSINGSNFGYCPSSSDSYFFSRYMNMWGWATWANRISNVDYSLSQWKKIKNPIYFLHQRLKNNVFDFDIAWYLYWKDKFDKSSDTKLVTWWDWQCIFYQIFVRQYSIVPSVNLVSNIGFANSATHTKDCSNPSSNIKSQSILFPLVHPQTFRIDYEYEEKYIKWIWCFHERNTFTNNIKIICKINFPFIITWLNTLKKLVNILV